MKENDKIYDTRELMFLPLILQRNSIKSTAPRRAKHVEVGRCFSIYLNLCFDEPTAVFMLKLYSAKVWVIREEMHYNCLL